MIFDNIIIIIIIASIIIIMYWRGYRKVPWIGKFKYYYRYHYYCYYRHNIIIMYWRGHRMYLENFKYICAHHYHCIIITNKRGHRLLKRKSYYKLFFFERSSLGWAIFVIF